MMTTSLTVMAEAELLSISSNSQPIEAAQLLTQPQIMPKADSLLSYEHKGIVIEDKQGRQLSLLKGNFGSIDHRLVQKGLLLATVDVDRQQAMVTVFDKTAQNWNQPVYIPQPAFKIDGVCLYQDEAHNGFLFLVGEEGHGEQWLVSD
ncbi:MAG TPA: 3-phytase, partial [Methylophaga sp.]|nr:3-phytase [Methylophaga sp.]